MAWQIRYPPQPRPLFEGENEKDNLTRTNSYAWNSISLYRLSVNPIEQKQIEPTNLRH